MHRGQDHTTQHGRAFLHEVGGRSPKKNFFIYYELDEEEVKTYLWYNGEDDGSWVLIEPAEGPKCGWPEWQLCGGCGRVKGVNPGLS